MFTAPPRAAYKDQGIQSRANVMSTGSATQRRRSRRLGTSAPAANASPLQQPTGNSRKNAQYSGVMRPEGVSAMTLAVEEQRIRSLLERVEEVEDVANSLPKGDERRTRLLNVTNATLAEEATIRPTIAAKLLGLDEKTVRAWAEQGVLTIAQRRPRLLLDLMSVHDMSHRIQQLREAGKHQGLLDEIWRQLNDQALVESDDFQESLAQVQRGEVVLRPLPRSKAVDR